MPRIKEKYWDRILLHSFDRATCISAGNALDTLTEAERTIFPTKKYENSHSSISLKEIILPGRVIGSGVIPREISRIESVAGPQFDHENPTLVGFWNNYEISLTENLELSRKFQQ